MFRIFGDMNGFRKLYNIHIIFLRFRKRKEDEVKWY